LPSFFVITHIVFRIVPEAVLEAVLGAVLRAESDIDIRVRLKSLYNSNFHTTPDVSAMQAFTTSS
jgi:hypothetical protein